MQNRKRIIDSPGAIFERSDGRNDHSGKVGKGKLSTIILRLYPFHICCLPGIDPCENDYIESFHIYLRNELLNGEIFHNLVGGEGIDRTVAKVL